jgi:hypothetical protein
MRGLGAIVNKSLKKELIINCKSDRQHKRKRDKGTKRSTKHYTEKCSDELRSLSKTNTKAFWKTVHKFSN